MSSVLGSRTCPHSSGMLTPMIQRTFCSYVYQKSSSCLKLNDYGIHFVKLSKERDTMIQLISFFFFRWFTLTGMRAKGRPALCRTWSRTEQSLPCHTMSSSFTSNSKFPNNLQRDFDNGATKSVYECVCACMLKKSEEDRRTLHLWRFTSLRKSSWAKLHHSNQAIRDRTDSDAYLALFFLCWITILEGRKKISWWRLCWGNCDYVSNWMNQCLFS